MCSVKVMQVLDFFILCSFIPYVLCVTIEFKKYHTNKELEQLLREFNRTTKNIQMDMYSVGKTKERNNLWVLKMTAVKPGKFGVPNIKLIGNMHGNEAAGREILLRFIEHLIENYRTNSEIGWLLNNTRIHIMPTMNPDGFEIANRHCKGDVGRTNGIDMIDLNRDFPDYFHPNKLRNALESKAVRKWMSEVPFILSAALHGGALVANYPFDSVKQLRWQKFIQRLKTAGDDKDEVLKIRLEYIESSGEQPYSATADDDVFKHLATVYSQNHLTMKRGKPCDNHESFEGGITNGAKWYAFEGSMGDYNYAKHGCMELTLEISCCKFPNVVELPKLWKENEMALLKYCMEALKGVTGRILDSDTREPIGGANLTIVGREMTFYSFSTGEFWRILLPGNYQLKVEVEGYYTTFISFTVNDYRDSFPELTYLEVDLYNRTSHTTTTVRTTTQQIFTSSPTSVRNFLSSRIGFDSIAPEPAASKEVGSTSVGDTIKKIVFLYVFLLLHLCVIF